MRRGTILVLGLLMASTAMPQTADARPLLLKMLGGLTSPLGAIVGAGRHSGRRVPPRRAVVSRPKPTAPVAAVAGATAAGAAAAAITTGTATSDPAAAPESQASASAATAVSSPDASAATPQRNAALTAPDDETQGRSGETGRAAPSPTPMQYHLGTVGPLAWPSAYEDVIGFTLWPKEYGERLRTHGIGDVLATAFAPNASLAARTQPRAGMQARAEEPGSPAKVAMPSSVCGSVDLTTSDWPMAQITASIELDAQQRAALDRFKTTLNDAVSSIKSTCRDDANYGPVERIRALQNTLWAVHDAAQLIRTPLAAFYDSLTEEQKQKFAAPASPQANGRAPSRSDMARMCDLPTSADAPIRRIEQALRPTKEQRTSLDMLQKKGSEMGQFLLASCLKPLPATPMERLDAAADRLTAVIFAASNVNMALNDFTRQLSDEQKGKLDSLVR